MSQNAHSHEDKLLEFAYGELPTAEARALEAHVKGCTRCSGALDSIRDVRVTMSKLVPEPVPSGGLDSLLAYAQQTARRTQAGRPPKTTWFRRAAFGFVGVAAVALVVVVANETVRGGWSPTKAALQSATHAGTTEPAAYNTRVDAPSPEPEAAKSEAPPAPDAVAVVPKTSGDLGDTAAAPKMIAKAPEAKRRAVEGHEVTRRDGNTGANGLAVEVERQEQRKGSGSVGGSTSSSTLGELATQGGRAGPAKTAPAIEKDERAQKEMVSSREAGMKKSRASAGGAMGADDAYQQAAPGKTQGSAAPNGLDQLALRDRKADAAPQEESLSLRGRQQSRSTQQPQRLAELESNVGSGYGAQTGPAPARPAYAPPSAPAASAPVVNVSPPQQNKAYDKDSSPADVQQNYNDEVALQRDLNTPNLSMKAREDILTRLCDAEEARAKSDGYGCSQLRIEFPRPYSKRLATRRGQSQQVDSESKAKMGAPAKASAKPAATDPAAQKTQAY